MGVGASVGDEVLPLIVTLLTREFRVDEVVFPPVVVTPS
jgi:hypothetical protein